MQDPESRPGTPRVKRLVRFFALLVGVVVLYQGARWTIRAYTTGLIEGVEGRDLPAFVLEDRDGRSYSPASLRGKTVVLNFFRSKCHNCREERDDIRAFARELDPERVVLLGVMMDEVQGFPPEVTETTLSELAYEHPVLMADAAFVDAFHGAGWAHITPVTYVADGNGVIVRCLRHPYGLEDLRAAIR